MGKKVVVIGAGPAGIMAAGEAAKNRNDVVLIERNSKIGRKLSISGKGRCNITNNTDIDGLMSNIPGNGKFLYSAFSRFSNKDIVDFFNSNGLKTKVERGERVFPVSDDAKDVVRFLERYLKKNNVDLKFNSGVKKINVQNKKVTGVTLETGEIIKSDSVILATGGASYPRTGSDGNGYRLAKEVGHAIVPIKPSLIPLVAKEDWVRGLQGLSLRNVAINIKNSKNKEIYKDFGEMIFTHYGVSGPIILSGSRHILKYDYKNVILSIDLKPALDFEKLDNRLIRDFEKFSNKQFKNSLDELLPQKIIPVIIKLSGISPDKMVNQISKEERKELTSLLKNLQINIIGSRPIEEAIVSVGGVSTKEINPQNMKSKLIEGLYFAGEIIDVDGYTGGFNLTIAFSTGYLAGISQI